MGYFTDSLIQRIAPRPTGGGSALAAWQNYADALKESDRYFYEAGVTSRDRLIEILSQWMHECDGLTILWENMSYSTVDRIMEIFGEGHHSAKVTWGEAPGLVHQPYKLGERVYGLGNPKKARELGNTEPGDGYNFRGWHIQQLTGGNDHRRMAAKLGVTVEQLHSDPVLGIRASLFEWIEKGCNPLADRGDTETITRRINGGLNGYSDRLAWKRKLSRLILTKPVWVLDGKSDPAPAPVPAVEAPVNAPVEDVAVNAAPVTEAKDMNPNLANAQERLKVLGYNPGRVDGETGPMVRTAILSFQDNNGLTKTGELDYATYALIMGKDAKPFPVAPDRQNMTAEDLHKEGSETVGAVWAFLRWVKAAAAVVWGLIMDEVAGTGYLDTAIKFFDKTKEVRNRLPDVPSGMGGNTTLPHIVPTHSTLHIKLAIIVVILTIVSFLGYKFAVKVLNRRVAEARSGDNRSK